MKNGKDKERDKMDWLKWVICAPLGILALLIVSGWGFMIHPIIGIGLAALTLYSLIAKPELSDFSSRD